MWTLSFTALIIAVDPIDAACQRALELGRTMR
jgi:hypothetical protein